MNRRTLFCTLSSLSVWPMLLFFQINNVKWSSIQRTSVCAWPFYYRYLSVLKISDLNKIRKIKIYSRTEYSICRLKKTCCWNTIILCSLLNHNFIFRLKPNTLKTIMLHPKKCFRQGRSHRLFDWSSCTRKSRSKI